MSNIIEPGGEPEEPIITADALLSLLAVPFQSIGQLVGDIQTEIDQQLGSVLREIQQDQYILAAQITDKLVQPLKVW